MENNLYNNDPQFEKIVKTLKSLPKINTASNFEFNLMTRIQNKNFVIESEKRRYNKAWILAPSFTAVAAAVLLFFVFSDNQIEFENLLMQEPKMRSEIVASPEPEVTEAQSAKSAVADNTPQVEEEIAKDERYRVVVKPNDVVVKERIAPTFDENKSVDLDNFMNGRKIQNKVSSRALLAGGGSQSDFNFDGFIFRGSDKQMEVLRRQIDSIRSSMQQQNNLK